MLTIKSTSIEEAKTLINRLSWFQTFELSHEDDPSIVAVSVAGREDTKGKIEAMRLPKPEHVMGKSVLVVGVTDGIVAFLMEELGARSVDVIEPLEWKQGDSERCFDLLKTLLKSRVNKLPFPWTALGSNSTRYDIVICDGVFHRLDNPGNSIDKLTKITKQLLIIECLVDMLDIPRPAAAYYPEATLGGDSNNYWALNRLAMTFVLKEAGFASIFSFDPWSYNILQMTQFPYQTTAKSNGRAVFHAYKDAKHGVE